MGLEQFRMAEDISTNTTNIRTPQTNMFSLLSGTRSQNIFFEANNIEVTKLNEDIKYLIKSEINNQVGRFKTILARFTSSISYSGRIELGNLEDLFNGHNTLSNAVFEYIGITIMKYPLAAFFLNAQKEWLGENLYHTIHHVVRGVVRFVILAKINSEVQKRFNEDMLFDQYIPTFILAMILHDSSYHLPNDETLPDINGHEEIAVYQLEELMKVMDFGEDNPFLEYLLKELDQEEVGIIIKAILSTKMNFQTMQQNATFVLSEYDDVKAIDTLIQLYLIFADSDFNTLDLPWGGEWDSPEEQEPSSYNSYLEWEGALYHEFLNLGKMVSTRDDFMAESYILLSNRYLHPVTQMLLGPLRARNAVKAKERLVEHGIPVPQITPHK